VKIITESIKRLSPLEIKERLREISTFMERPLAEYWDIQKDQLSKEIHLPKIHITDPFFKNNKITPVLGDIIQIKEKIEYGSETLMDYRLRIIV